MAHVTLSIAGSIATITLDRPKALNALTLDDYQLLATLLRRAAANDAVIITVITGKGKYFSAYGFSLSSEANSAHVVNSSTSTFPAEPTSTPSEEMPRA